MSSWRQLKLFSDRLLVSRRCSGTEAWLLLHELPHLIHRWQIPAGPLQPVRLQPELKQPKLPELVAVKPRAFLVGPGQQPLDVFGPKDPAIAG